MWGGYLLSSVWYSRKNAISCAIYAFLRFRQLPSASVRFRGLLPSRALPREAAHLGIFTDGIFGGICAEKQSHSSSELLGPYNDSRFIGTFRRKLRSRVPIFATRRPIKHLVVTICTDARSYRAKFRKNSRRVRFSNIRN